MGRRNACRRHFDRIFYLFIFSLFSFFHRGEIHSLRPASGERRARARARSLALSVLFVDFFSSPVRAAAIAAVRESHNGADTTNDSSWHRRRQPGGRATRPVSAECNSPKTMHRVKMARIDNPLPSRSIPRTRIIHMHASPESIFAGWASTLLCGREGGRRRASTRGRKRGLAIRAAETGPIGEGKSEGRRKTSRSFRLLRPYISPILARLPFPPRTHNVFRPLSPASARKRSAPRVVNGKNTSRSPWEPCALCVSLSLSLSLSDLIGHANIVIGRSRGGEVGVNSIGNP